MKAPLSTEQKIAAIERAIAIVRTKLASIPSANEADGMAIRAAEKRVKAELQKQLGGKFWYGSDGKFHLQMAQVEASSHTEHFGVFRQWQICASRKIIMIKLVAA